MRPNDQKRTRGGIETESTYSPFLDEESRAALRWFAGCVDQQTQQMEMAGMPSASILEFENRCIRRRHAQSFYDSELYRQLVTRYPTACRLESVAGIDCEVFVPRDVDCARTRLLINLHGGAFMHGARISSHLESAPVASCGGFKVVSVDYRLAPEHRYPAGTEDVLAVYEELIRHYSPQRIGIYGCSAGALLTAQVLMRLQQNSLPLPAAVALLFGGAYHWYSGDSARISAAIDSESHWGTGEEPYFEGVNREDSEAFPGYSTDVLRKFTPTLLLSATRDFALSSVVQTHSRLVNIGKRSELYVWEGLDHAFHYNPKLSASAQVHETVVRFFNEQLGAA